MDLACLTQDVHSHPFTFLLGAPGVRKIFAYVLLTKLPHQEASSRGLTRAPFWKPPGVSTAVWLPNSCHLCCFGQYHLSPASWFVVSLILSHRTVLQAISHRCQNRFKIPPLNHIIFNTSTFYPQVWTMGLLPRKENLDASCKRSINIHIDSFELLVRLWLGGGLSK